MDDQFVDREIMKVIPYDDGFEVEVAEIETKDANTARERGVVFIPKVDSALPEVGGTMRIYGENFQVRGVFVDGAEVFYRTEEEDRADEQERVAKAKEARKAAYEADKPDHDARIAKMPQTFQDRIQGFRDRNPEFGPEFESYELFSCEQAIIIANTLKTPEAIQQFVNKPYTEQKEMVPDLSDDHSGNTLGFAIRLAYFFAEDPEDTRKAIFRYPGALAALIGSNEYGCWSTSEEAAEERAKKAAEREAAAEST